MAFAGKDGKKAGEERGKGDVPIAMKLKALLKSEGKAIFSYMLKPAIR